MDDIEQLWRYLRHVVKIYRVEEGADTIAIDVVCGLDADPANPSVQVERVTLRRTPELESLIRSPGFKDLVYQPRARGILLLDVSGYSRFDTIGQIAILTVFKNALEGVLRPGDDASPGVVVEQIVPTGDGCYVIFHDRFNDTFLRAVYNLAAEFHARQARLLKRMGDPSASARVRLRFACHVGEVEFFRDAAGNRNCCGTGMNDAARVLELGSLALLEKQPDACMDAVVFLSDEVRGQAADLRARLLREVPASGVELVSLGCRRDKHGQPMTIHCLAGLAGCVAAAWDRANTPG